MKLLSQVQRRELDNFLLPRVQSGIITKDHYSFLTSSSNQVQTYRDLKADLPIRLPGMLLLPPGNKLVRVTKYIPRGKGKKPAKVLCQVRLEQDQVEGLRALGDNVSVHIRQAVSDYLETKKRGGGSSGF